MSGITMDGKQYRVRVKYCTLTRGFQLEGGENEGYMLSRRHERDLAGTRYPYQLAVEPNPAYPDDYDNFFYDISAPVDSHSITLPFGQSTITFEAEIGSGQDIWQGKIAGENRWTGLEVTFTPIDLQRRVE